jgi:hypothetical protein
VKLTNFFVTITLHKNFALNHIDLRLFYFLALLLFIVDFRVGIENP